MSRTNFHKQLALAKKRGYKGLSYKLLSYYYKINFGDKEERIEYKRKKINIELNEKTSFYFNKE